MRDTNPSRRSLMRSLLTLPALTLVGEDKMLAQAGPSDSAPLSGEEAASQIDQFQERYRSVRILRAFNTMQARTFERSGRFGSLSELVEAGAVDAFKSDSRAQRIGIGKTLLDSLNLEGAEIVPGWTFNLHASQNRSEYLMAIANETLGAFTTDQKWIIYEGKRITKNALHGRFTAASIIVGGVPLNTQKGDISKLSRIAFALLPADSNCCRQFPCCCEIQGHCFPTPLGFYCYNCGCAQCVWCCEI